MITTDEVADAQAEFLTVMDHTYTRTPRLATADNPSTPSTDESQDPWGEQVTTAGTAQVGQPCKYMDVSTPVVTQNGLINVNVPTLMVPSTDPIALGDQVSNVRDAKSVLLLSGPVPVEDTSPRLEGGGTALYIEVRLRQTQQV